MNKVEENQNPSSVTSGSPRPALVSDLSPTMKAAWELAAKYGGKLIRFPGGYWAQQGWDSHSRWFATPTIQALVSRGVASYSTWYEGRSRFPIEITLNVPARDMAK